MQTYFEADSGFIVNEKNLESLILHDGLNIFLGIFKATWGIIGIRKWIVKGLNIMEIGGGRY